VGSTEVETRLPFRHEVDSGMSLWGIGDDVRSDSGSPELTLLRSAPSIGVGQYEFDVARYRVPAVFSIVIGGNEQRFCRIEQIPDEVRENVDYRLSHREVCAHLVLQRCRWLCGSEQKLPPVAVSDGDERVMVLRTIASG
jgi:hypothetical protein